MAYTRWLLILSLVAFAACSDDEKTGGGDKVLTGTFVDGPVANLHYATATRSGLTNANGEFEYEQGETVTFAVGAITLGSAAGAARITPFDLFGIAPPTTPGEIRAYMQNEGVTAFDRVANVALFLQSLDNDGDHANGIDLTDSNDRLAGASLTFDWRIQEFASDIMTNFTRRYGGRGEIPLTQPLRRLYAALGITISGNAVAEYRFDSDNDGAPNRIDHYEYDAEGRRTVHRDDSDADGNDDYRYIDTYGANGLLAVSRGESEAGGDDYDESTYTYDALGHKVLTVRTTVGGGVILRSIRSTRTFGADGRLQTEISETDMGGDGSVDSREGQFYTYDANGSLIELRHDSDSDADGVPSSSDTVTYTYDANLRAATIERGSDFDADGDFDALDRISYTYDAASRRVTDTRELLSVTNGEPTSRVISTYVYDADGRTMSTRVERDTNVDGVPNSVETASYEFNAAGRLLRLDSTKDDNGDGTTDGITHEVRTYDDAGNLTQSLTEDDYGADGSVDYRSRITATFDAEANITSRVRETDSNGDGVYDFGSRADSDYTPIPNVLEQVLSQFLDVT